MTDKKAFRVAVDFPWDASACMGTGAYSETMARALAMSAPEWTITLIVGRDAGRRIDLPNVNYAVLPEVSGIPEGTRQVALPAFLAENNFDCLFAPATLLPLVRVCPMVPTVHDLVFLRHPEYYAPALVEYLKRWVEPALRAADHVVAISDAAKADLVQLLKFPEERITVIPQPLRETFSQSMPRDEQDRHLRDLGAEGPYFFHVSNLAPHKNVVFALEALARFLKERPGSRHRLVVAGGGIAPNRPPDIVELARKLSISSKVQFVGRVDDVRLKALYQGCDAFLFPSLTEGWGLPVAEASALGVRVIASPYVPSAAEGQKCALEVERWVEAMADSETGRSSLGPVDASAAGQGLMNVLREVATGSTETSPQPSRLPGISGCTILRNGVKLRYPLEESIASYAPICDEIVLCWDPTSEDETAALVRRMKSRFPQVRLVESVWDMKNRREGSELARQTQFAFDHCRREWTLYIQADEALHEDFHDELKDHANRRKEEAVAFRRSSFLGTLDAEIPDHRAAGLVRMFRTGYGRSVGDAMHVRVEGHPSGVRQSEAMLFNYSRLGSTDDIVTRCVNLHRFYHDDGWLAARDTRSELQVQTVPYRGTHPAPIEASFRLRMRAGEQQRAPRVGVNIIAQEGDAFGADLLASCLDSLEGYADQIVIVDNGLGVAAKDVVMTRRDRLPLTVVDARDVSGDFSELRNRALAATDERMTHIHKVDTDEVYLPGTLAQLKRLLADPSIDQVNATLIHFMIDPTLVESVQAKTVVFRRDAGLAWTGPVHERMKGPPQGGIVDGPGCFLHFGYCRPQWQTMLKWLRYARLQGGSLSHYQYEYIDGVRRPWFRDGRTPDTILEPRRNRLQAYKDPYPPSVRTWLEAFAASGLPWRTWVDLRVGGGMWQTWQNLRQKSGNWEDTLAEALVRSAEPPVATSQAVSRGSSGPREEFRRGFSIIIPTWNNLLYLQKAIESIRRHSDFDHEIVLHVNEGSDGTLEWVRKSGFKHTFTPENVGVCTAVNLVTDLCSRDLVLYFNDDMVALPEWDRHLVDYAEHHDIDRLLWLSATLIEPTGANADFIAPADYGTDIQKFREEELLADLQTLRHRKADSLGTTWAPNLMYRETFDRIGRFSEDFSPGFGSDPDLAKKLWDLGARNFISVGKSLVYHFQCKGTGKIPRHLHNDAHGTFLRKYGMTIQDFAQGVLRRESRAPMRIQASVGGRR